MGTKKKGTAAPAPVPEVAEDETTQETWHPEKVAEDFIATMPRDSDVRRFFVCVLRKAAHEMIVSGVSPARALELVAEEIEAAEPDEEAPKSA